MTKNCCSRGNHLRKKSRQKSKDKSEWHGSAAKRWSTQVCRTLRDGARLTGIILHTLQNSTEQKKKNSRTKKKKTRGKPQKKNPNKEFRRNEIRKCMLHTYIMPPSNSLPFFFFTSESRGYCCLPPQAHTPFLKRWKIGLQKKRFIKIRATERRYV